MRRKRRAPLLKAAAFMLLLAYVLSAAAIALLGLRDRSARADLIVVPGSKVMSDGRPSARLQARLDVALHAYRRGLAPLILVSGGTGKEGFDESAVMADYLVQQGVPRNALILDPAGVDTAATAANVQTIARERGIKTALVATQYFHVPRLQLALEQQGVPVVAHLHAPYFEWRDLYSALREVPAYALYWIRPQSASPALPAGAA